MLFRRRLVDGESGLHVSGRSQLPNGATFPKNTVREAKNTLIHRDVENSELSRRIRSRGKSQEWIFCSEPFLSSRFAPCHFQRTRPNGMHSILAGERGCWRSWHRLRLDGIDRGLDSVFEKSETFPMELEKKSRGVENRRHTRANGVSYICDQRRRTT